MSFPYFFSPSAESSVNFLSFNCVFSFPQTESAMNFINFQLDFRSNFWNWIHHEYLFFSLQFFISWNWILCEFHFFSLHFFLSCNWKWHVKCKSFFLHFSLLPSSIFLIDMFTIFEVFWNSSLIRLMKLLWLGFFHSL